MVASLSLRLPYLHVGQDVEGTDLNNKRNEKKVSRQGYLVYRPCRLTIAFVIWEKQGLQVTSSPTCRKFMLECLSSTAGA